MDTPLSRCTFNHNLITLLLMVGLTLQEEFGSVSKLRMVFKARGKVTAVAERRETQREGWREQERKRERDTGECVSGETLPLEQWRGWKAQSECSFYRCLCSTRRKSSQANKRVMGRNEDLNLIANRSSNAALQSCGGVWFLAQRELNRSQ